MAGERIDSSLGLTLGASTLLAAGLGNIFADVAGVLMAERVVIDYTLLTV